MTPPRKPPLQFGLRALFIAIALVATVAAILAWIEPQRKAPLVSVIGSTLMIVGAGLALVRAVRNLIGRQPPAPPAAPNGQAMGCEGRIKHRKWEHALSKEELAND